MRLVTLKSLCLVAGFIVPCLGTASRSEAGIIPWVYDSIFGYGWGGGGYGMGYGGGYAYSAPYSGYAAPVGYTTNYGGDYGGWSVADNCCCSPCVDSCGGGCGPGGCAPATSIESAKPAVAPKEPTPADTRPRTAPVDNFDRRSPTSPAERIPETPAEELRGIDRNPIRRSIPAETDENMNTPIEEGPENLEGARETHTPPSSPSITMRYAPESRRFSPTAVRLTGRVVRVDRPVSGPAATDTKLATR